MKKIPAIISAGIVLTLAGGAFVVELFAAKKYPLKYAMDAESKFTVTVTAKHRDQREFMGNVIVDNTTDAATYEFNVRSATGSGMALDMEYVARSRVTDDSQIQAGPDFSGLIGESVGMFLAFDGNVSDFEGFEDLPPVAIADTRETLGKDHYISQLEDLFLPLPDEMVGIGESWSGEKIYYERSGDASIPVKISYSYSLVERTRKAGAECLKITGSYTVRVEGGIVAGGMDLLLNLEGEGTETAYFAVNKGMLLSSESCSVVEGSAVNEDLGVSIPMKHNNDRVVIVSFD